MKGEGYAIFLIPSSEVYSKLSGIISSLGKKYSTPIFEPHVTVLATIQGKEKEIIEKTSRFAGLLKPCTVRLTTVDYFDEYWRCLFIRVEKTKPVIHSMEKASGIFGFRFYPEFLPHLSLMYGNFPKGTKEKIISEIGRAFNLAFEARSLHLVDCSGEPEEFRRVREFPIG